MPKVSVIIPTYNREALLKQAVDSVQKQTYNDLEIIIVDDGSNANTADLANEFPDNVLYLKQDHAGLNAARNFAIDHARGEYIALLDDDDIWLPYKVALQVKILDYFEDIAFTFSDFYIWKEDGQKIPKALETWHDGPLDMEKVLGHRVSSNSIPGCSKLSLPEFNIFTGNLYFDLMRRPEVLPSCAMYRKSSVPKEVKFVVDDIHCGDWDFFARLSKIHDCAFVDLETVLNRSHGDNVRLTRKSMLGQTTDRLNLLDRVWKNDTGFYDKNREAVDNIEEKILLKITRLHLFENKINEARDTLYRYFRLLNKRHMMEAYVYMIISRLPYGSKLLNQIRKFKHGLKNSAANG